MRQMIFFLLRAQEKDQFMQIMYECIPSLKLYDLFLKQRIIIKIDAF